MSGARPADGAPHPGTQGDAAPTGAVSSSDRADCVGRRHVFFFSGCDFTLFYLRQGTWWQMYCLSWPPAVAVFTPFLLVCFLLIGVPLLALAGGWLVASGLQSIGAGLAAGLLGAVALWLAGRRIEARYSMYWMMRSYAFTAQQARGEVPDLEQRLDALARRLVERVQARDDDEVLVVGHSSGAIMAASIMARALRLSPTLASGRTRVALLTVG